jgi:hypothetical protein
MRQVTPTTRPKEHMLSPLVCMKSVIVLPSTGKSSREAKSATCTNYSRNIMHQTLRALKNT